MCGLTGIIDPRVTEDALESSLMAIHHRGPDSRGIFIDPRFNLGLAHARLAIVDLETGGQPLLSADEQVVLVSNGEIYDFEALRSGLENEGQTFRTRSDSEVIVNLYLQHRLRFFEYLRGEFAFLLFDRAQSRLFVVRDRFGIKPLYVARTDRDGWVFSSEVKGIFATGLVKRELGLGLHLLLARDEQATIFKGVRHLGPGTALVIDLRTGAHEVIPYWKPDFPRTKGMKEKDIAHYIKETDEVLTESIRLRLRADVPVGLYLSGGLDSALVAAKVRWLAGQPPQAFTVAFTEEGGPYNEAIHARILAEHIGVEHHVLEVGESQLWDNLEACLWHVEAPLIDLAPVGKYLLSALARRHVKAVLTGEGADEVFLGYSIFRKAVGSAGRLSLRLSNGSRSALARLLWGSIIHPGVDGAEAPVFEGGSPPSRDLSQLAGRHPLVKLQYLRLKNHLMPTILAAYGDRTEMAHSIEGRVPFLDHHLFELARLIPPHYKIREGMEKYILRRIAAPWLPAHVLERHKWPFSTRTPVIRERRHRPLDRLIQEYLSRGAIERAGLFRWKALCYLQQLRTIPALRGFTDRFLFHVLCLQILHHQFIESPSGFAHDIANQRK